MAGKNLANKMSDERDSVIGATTRPIVHGKGPDNIHERDIDFVESRKMSLRIIVEGQRGTPEEIALAQKQLLDMDKKEEGVMARIRKALKKVFGVS